MSTVEQLNKEVAALNTANLLTQQRIKENERSIGRAFQEMAGMRGEARVQNEQFEKTLKSLTTEVNKMSGGVAALKWIIPLWVSAAVAAVAMVLSAVMR